MDRRLERRSGARRRAAVAALSMLAPLVAVLGPPPALAAGPGRPLMAYLTTADGIVPVDLRTRALGALIRTPATPAAMVVAPGGRTGYLLVAGALRPVDLVAGTLLPGTALGVQAGSIALTPDGRTAWVTDSGPARDVTPVDLATGRAGTPVRPGGGDVNITLGSIAITPDGSTAYVTTKCWGAVYPIDLGTGRVGTAISPPSGGNYPCPDSVAIAPDGRTGYIADGFSTAGLSPFDVATGRRAPPVDISAASAGDVTVAPGGRRVFVTTDSALVTVDGPAGRVLHSSPIDQRGHYAVHPSGRELLVPLAGGGVAPLDTASSVQGATFAAGLQVLRVVVAPDQAPRAAFSVSDAGGRLRRFDASASVGSTSPVMTYYWDYGDGTGLQTADPVAEHTYTGPGPFTVRLRVVDRNGTSTQDVFGSTMLLRHGLPRAATTRTVTVS